MDDSKGPSLENELDKSLALKQIVIGLDEYKNECSGLEELFIRSREDYQDPQEVLSIQESLFNNLIRYQQLKFIATNSIDAEMYKELISVTRSIADSLAWRILNYDERLAQLFFSHPQTGALNQSSIKELEEAKKIVEETNAHVLLNDLTNFLRFGDLTIVDENGIRLVEVKEAGKKAKSGRITRQKQQLRELNELLSGNSETVTVDGVTVHFVKIEYTPRTYHFEFQRSIDKAREEGYSVEYITPFFAIEVFDLTKWNELESTLPAQRAFRNQGAFVGYHSHMPFNSRAAISSIAPFGIFPLNNKDCFDLICGNLLIRNTLLLNGIAEVYANQGISLIKQPVSQEDRDRMNKSLINSPQGSRDQALLTQQGFFEYWLISDSIHIKVEQSYFNDITTKLLNINDFVLADRLKIELVKNLVSNGRFNLGNSTIFLKFNVGNNWR